MCICPIVQGHLWHVGGLDSLSLRAERPHLRNHSRATFVREPYACFFSRAVGMAPRKRPLRCPPETLAWRAENPAWDWVIKTAIESRRPPTGAARWWSTLREQEDRRDIGRWHHSDEDGILSILVGTWLCLAFLIVQQSAMAIRASFGSVMALCCVLFKRRIRTKYEAAGEFIGGKRYERRRASSTAERIAISITITYTIRGACGFRGCEDFFRKVVAVAMMVFYETRRIGEADNPGPATTTNAACNSPVGACEITEAAGDLQWKKALSPSGLSYPEPYREGFRGALAPGYADPEPARMDKARCRLELCIETANTTGWGPLRRRLDETSAHVLVAQETWVLLAQVAEASTWARRHGWTSIWAPACIGPGGGASGGVALFVRKEFGLREPSVGSHIIWEGRAVMGILDVPGHRPTIITSAYLIDGEGLSGGNGIILDHIGMAVRAQGVGYQFIIGGDFQNSPSAVNGHGLPVAIGGKVVAADTARGTYRAPRGATNIDFFIISAGLVAALAEVSLMEGTGVKGHVPIQLRFKANPISIQTLAIRQP